MKAFNLNDAMLGKPVCTRNGCNVKIIAYDRVAKQPIVALVQKNKKKPDETIETFYSNGRFSKENESKLDLFMKPTKKEGFINVFKSSEPGYCLTAIYDSKEEALKMVNTENYNYIITIKINWEE